jgi:parallel beta-helix repeat protein
VNLPSSARLRTVVAFATLVTAIAPVFLAESASAASCTGIQIAAGASIQSAINGHSSNTTFCLGAGTFTVGSSITPKSYDKFIGTSVARDGVVVKTGSAQVIFRADNTTGVTFRHFAITGAVNACPGTTCGPTGRAISRGTTVLIDDMHVFGNGQAGVAGSTGGLVVTNSEIDHNGASVGDGVSAGVRSNYSVNVQGSSIHDNTGSGIWCTAQCGAFTVTGSTVTSNAASGIFDEISQGAADFHGNVVTNNNALSATDQGGINVTDSKNAVIYSNTLGSNKNFGVAARMDSRINCGSPSAGCGYVVSNLAIHDNTLNGDALVGCSLAGVTCGTTATTTTTMPATTTTTMPTTSTTMPTTTTTTMPATACSGTSVLLGTSIQSAIDSHAQGTTFCLSPGTYNLGSSISPKDGDTFVGTGTTRDDTVVRTSSVQLLFDMMSRDNVTLRHFAITGAINRCPGVNCGATGRAVSSGTNIHIEDMHLYANGLNGIGAAGAGLTVNNSEIDHNGYKVGDGVSDGIKATNPFTVTNSFLHDNQNSGIHCDIQCGAFTISNNTVTGNTGTGLFMEISQGPAVISGNTVHNNNVSNSFGKGGIGIVDSKNVEIYKNNLGGNKIWGIRAYTDNRVNCGTANSGCGFVLSNISIHDNTLNGNTVVGCDTIGVLCTNNI